MADAADETLKQVQTLVEKAWGQITNGNGWAPQVSMPFPKAWNGKPTAILWHAYADRMTPTLVDAVEVSHPWAWIELRPEADAKPHIQVLSQMVEILGRQGVRPVTSEELKVSAGEPPLWQSLRKGEASDSVRKRARQWMQFNGVIFQAIAPHHPEFIHWLNA